MSTLGLFLSVQRFIHRLARVSVCLAALAVLMLATPEIWQGPSHANARLFAYTYETATLAAGDVELETWTTFKIGRERFYNRYDQRLELEWGITDRLQAALYLNLSAYAQRLDDGSIQKDFKMPGLSLEFKYRLLDAVADPVGLALYLEVAGKPHEGELEAKVLVDKQIGKLKLAFNAVVENEWKVATDGTESEFAFEFDLGIAYQITRGFSLGLEVRSAFKVDDDWGVSDGALFAGLTAGFRAKSWWGVLSVMPQIVGLAGTPSGSSRNLTKFENAEARLLFGFHL